MWSFERCGKGDILERMDKYDLSERLGEKGFLKRGIFPARTANERRKTTDKSHEAGREKGCIL
jgi:hypothetical protein